MLHLIFRSFFVVLAALTPVVVPNASMTEPSASTTVGGASHGFAVSLSTVTADVQLGSPIWVTLEIRNVSGKVQYVTFGDRHNGYQFEVLNQTTNKAAERNAHSVFGLDPFSGPSRGRPVPAHFSKYLHFQLNDLYNIKDSGVYRIKCAAAHIFVEGLPVALPPSNTIVIRVN